MTRSKSRTPIHASGGSKAEVKARAKGSREAGSARKTRPPQAIIDTNRKTEICRNWQKGCCTFEGRCAFAHGVKELKYRTLREMENAGRITDANKYRCYPCMTWVATGSCPFGTRCIFIHDPRVEGPEQDLLLASYPGVGITTFFPAGNSPFFFPDISRDIDSTEVPTYLARYDIDSRTDSISGASCWTAHTLWYSFVSMFENPSIISEKPDTVVKNSRTSTGTDIKTNTHARSPKSRRSIAPGPLHLAGGNICHPQSSNVVATTGANGKTGAPPRRSSRSTSPLPSYATVAATAKSDASGLDSSHGVASFSPASKQKHHIHPEEEPEFSRSKTGVKHLPVFEGLSRGTPARSSASSTPEKSYVNSRMRTSDSFNTSGAPTAPPSQATPSTNSSAFSFWASSLLQPAADEASPPLHTDDGDIGTTTSNSGAVSFLSESSSASDSSSYFSAYGEEGWSARGVDVCPGESLEVEPPTRPGAGELVVNSPSSAADGRSSDDPERKMTFLLTGTIEEEHQGRASKNNYYNDRNQQEQAVSQYRLQTNDSGVIGQPLAASSNTSLASTSILGGCCSNFSYFGGGQASSPTGTSNSTRSTTTMMSSAPSTDLGTASIAVGRAYQQQYQWQSVFGATGVDDRLGAIEGPGISAKDGSDDGNCVMPSYPEGINPADGLIRHSGYYHGHHFQEAQPVVNSGMEEGGAGSGLSDDAGSLRDSFDSALYNIASAFPVPPS